jgi:hypothetical protein
MAVLRVGGLRTVLAATVDGIAQQSGNFEMRTWRQGAA